jgi:ubiquinone/menaquinone biosynthesis C-methylase UbiE
VPLTAEQARLVYDRIGRMQDTQRFHEAAPTARLTRAANFAEATAVFELGCGTGRLAAGLFAGALAGDARYLGVDVSATMVRLARRRLAAWSPQAEFQLIEPPALALPGADASFDRFVATYVLDLLSDGHTRALIGEARRLLAAGGLLALVGLTHGTTAASRLVAGSWRAVAERLPGLVGGCRPIELRELLKTGPWEVVEHDVVISRSVPSEVLVAARLGRLMSGVRHYSAEPAGRPRLQRPL